MDDQTAISDPGHVLGCDWLRSARPVGYADAVATMAETVARIRTGSAADTVWLLEHPPIFTAGTSALDRDLFNPLGFPTFASGRGGQWTYHGPGQRVAYVMLDLNRRGADIRRYVCNLEEWLIQALSRFDVTAERRAGRVGLWVDMPRYGGRGEAKIAAIGVRVRRWVTFHGVALNVDPDLSHFGGIVPCGIRGHGVTSLAALGVAATMAEVDYALRMAWDEVFRPCT